MKKVTSLLLAGITVLAMSGCDDDDIIIKNGIQSVDITVLTGGYKVTGTGGLGDDPEVESIEFCGNEAAVYFPDVMETATDTYFVSGDGVADLIGFDWFEAFMDTTAAGTTGTLDVGVTYSLDSYDVETNAWTITNIEEVECTPDLEPTGITHNGITYDFVTSPATNRVWLDRNLGASQVCTSITDSECFGGYYQWGRAHDGHQDPSNGTLDVQASTLDNAGNKFIITFKDWTTQDSTGATRSANWGSTDGSSVCPVGFRVPTGAELRAEISGHIANNSEAFASFLKLPSPGYRTGTNGSILSSTTFMYLWVTDINPSFANDIYISPTTWGTHTAFRSEGYTVRCIKNNTI